MANYKDNMPRTAEPFNMVYFHGFASSGATGTAELLRKIFPSSEILPPTFPLTQQRRCLISRLFVRNTIQMSLSERVWEACMPSRCVGFCASV